MLVVSKVSPFEVEVALGINAQHVCVTGSYSSGNELFVPCSRIMCDCSFHI